MSNRIQVILSPEEQEAFRAQARREGLSLSAWLREAGRHRLESATRGSMRTVDELRSFFASLPDRHAPQLEPDWQEHRAVIDSSRASGRTST